MARYMRKGTTKVYWVPSISNTAAPLATEVNAGTRLDTQLAEVNGFTFQNNPIDTPVMSSAFIGKINGEDTTQDSSFTFYEDSVSNPIKTAQAKGNNGFVVILYAGTAGATPAAGDKVEIWPATVSSNARQYSAGNEAAKYQVMYSLTSAPNEATLA